MLSKASTPSAIYHVHTCSNAWGLHPLICKEDTGFTDKNGSEIAVCMLQLIRHHRRFSAIIFVLSA